MEVKDRKLTTNEIEILREAIIDYDLFTSGNSSEESMKRSLSKIKEKIDNNNISLLSDATLDSVFLVPALKKYNKYLSQCVRESSSEYEKNQYRPKLYCCNSLWRTLQDVFYEATGKSLE